MNTKVPLQPNKLQSALGLTETISSPRLRAGGPSSSHILNQLIERAKNDISRTASDVMDASDQVRTLASILGGQNAGMARMYSSLQSILTNIPNINVNGTHKALADFYGNYNISTDPTLTTADINPMFGQAILPAITRQNVLVIDRGQGELPGIPADCQLLVAIQPGVTNSAGAAAPVDYAFTEDVESIRALLYDDRQAWLIDDPNTFSHMAWVEIRLPGNVSNAYRCNELEIVLCPAFAASIVSIQAEVIGTGWQNLDFSYNAGYDSVSQTILNAGPIRLCFSETSITRFRIGLFVAGPWGFQSIRCLDSTYTSSATVTANFANYNPTSILSMTLFGANPTQLSYLTTSVAGNQVTCTLTPSASSNQSPVLTGIGISY